MLILLLGTFDDASIPPGSHNKHKLAAWLSPAQHRTQKWPTPDLLRRALWPPRGPSM